MHQKRECQEKNFKFTERILEKKTLTVGLVLKILINELTIRLRRATAKVQNLKIQEKHSLKRHRLLMNKKGKAEKAEKIKRSDIPRGN
jgi:hypothetical protein